MTSIDSRVPATTSVAHDTETHPATHIAPHGHQASLKDGLAFVNTLEFDRGRVIEHLPDVATSLVWFHDHALLHVETLAAETDRLAADGAASERTLKRVHRVRAAIRELLVATVDRRPPGSRELDEMNKALRFHYVTYLVPAPDGVSLDHKHEGRSGRGCPGAAGRVGRTRADPGPPGATAGVRERGVPLDLPGHLALGQAQVVRHAHLRQQGEGRSASAATT